jgi:hypothetical protein
MSRRASIIIAVLILLALLALLVYSLDRTSWLLAQYELSQPGTLADWLGLSPLALGVAAALVIEVGAVALVAGDVLALERSKIQRYATAGLFVVLAVQALANLLAGYLRGYASVRTTLEAHGASADAAWWIAGLSWVLSSAAVPALIFILSKLAAHVVRLAMSAPATAATEASDQRSEGAQERSVEPIEAETPSSAAGLLSAALSAAQNHALFPPSAPLEDDRSTAQSLSAEAIIPLDRHPCPHCGRALASGRAVGAAKTNGYCAHCKADRKQSA